MSVRKTAHVPVSFPDPDVLDEMSEQGFQNHFILKRVCKVLKEAFTLEDSSKICNKCVRRIVLPVNV